MMPGLSALLWLFCFNFLLLLMYDWFRYMGLTMVVADRKRWWHRPVSFALFAAFAALVLYNPWNGPWLYSDGVCKELVLKYPI